MTRFAGAPDESPGFLLWHATLRWQRAVAAALAGAAQARGERADRAAHESARHRAGTLHITARGSALARRAVAAVEQADAAFFGPATATFVRTLRRLGWPGL